MQPGAPKAPIATEASPGGTPVLPGPASGWIVRLPADRDLARLLRHARNRLIAVPRAAEGLACCIPCGCTAGCACRGALQRIESLCGTWAALVGYSPVRGLRAAAGDPATQLVSAAWQQSWWTPLSMPTTALSAVRSEPKGTPRQGPAQRWTPPPAPPLLPRLLPAMYDFNTGQQGCALLRKMPGLTLHCRHASSASSRCPQLEAAAPPWQLQQPPSQLRRR